MSLLKNIWNNKHLILEGAINKIQAKEEIVKLAKERKAICNTCPFNSANMNPEYHKGSMRIDEHCVLCGCNLQLKTYSLHSQCADNPPKWGAVMSQEDSNEIKDFIDPSNTE